MPFSTRPIAITMEEWQWEVIREVMADWELTDVDYEDTEEVFASFAEALNAAKSS